MTTTVLTPSLTVSLNGVDVTANVLAAEWSHGFKARSGQATLTMATIPADLDYWQAATITAGYVGSTVAQRFAGFVTDWTYQHWPRTYQVSLGGPLTLAARVLAPKSDAADYAASLAVSGELPDSGTTNVEGTVEGTVVTTSYFTYEGYGGTQDLALHPEGMEMIGLSYYDPDLDWLSLYPVVGITLQGNGGTPGDYNL